MHPRVWIGSLADYNNGILTGEWVEAAVQDEELLAAAHRIVARSEMPDAEEWAIFDADEFAGWQPGEYEDLALVAKVARGIAEHGPAFGEWAELHDADPMMLDSFTDAYLGEYDSPAAWAEGVMGELGINDQLANLPGELRHYVRFDYEGWAHDAQLSGEVYLATRPDGGVWVFQANL
jgi:antirestriction protein